MYGAQKSLSFCPLRVCVLFLQFELLLAYFFGDVVDEGIFEIFKRCRKLHICNSYYSGISFIPF